MWRGTIGFTLVSLGGFAPWVLAGRWFYRHIGEAGLYAICAVAFIGLSGVLLHRLIIGPGSLVRFYKLFSLAFFVYAVAWTAGWFTLHRTAGSTVGSIVGLLAGTAAMGVVLAGGFAAPGAMLKVIATLFVANAVGYFVGEWTHNAVLALGEGNPLGIVLQKPARATISKAAWGLFYGLGFGAGIGLAFYLCQAQARKVISG